MNYFVLYMWYNCLRNIFIFIVHWRRFFIALCLYDEKRSFNNVTRLFNIIRNSSVICVDFIAFSHLIFIFCTFCCVSIYFFRICLRRSSQNNMWSSNSIFLNLFSLSMSSVSFLNYCIFYKLILLHGFLLL